MSRDGAGQVLKEAFGSAVAVEHGSWGSRVLQHLMNLFLFGIPVILGLRPPWELVWLAIPLIPFVSAFWIYVVVFARKAFRQLRMQRYILWIFIGNVILLVLGFVFTSFGVDPSGRYFVPLTIPLSIFASIVVFYLIKNKWIQWTLISIVTIFNIIGTVQCGIKNPPGITTQFYEPSIVDHSYDQELIKFLKENNETKGYSNYWVTYPIAFLSNEEVIFIPRLPYHLDQSYTLRDDRYQPYDIIVAQADHVAYITTRNSELDEAITHFLIPGVSNGKKN